MKWAKNGLGAAVVVFAAIQLIPYGRIHENYSHTAEPRWDSARTRELAVRACFDCHSGQTEWPWYASVAPVSWLVASHVDEGRAILDFSRWDRPYEEAHEAGETVLEGEMPPDYYRRMHASARLTDRELRDLAAGLNATLGGDHRVGEVDDD
jgi:hypothetical protein